MREMKNHISSLKTIHSIFPLGYFKLEYVRQKTLEIEFHICIKYKFCHCLLYFSVFFWLELLKRAKLAKKTQKNKVNDHRIHILYKYKNPFPTFFGENL